MPAAAWVNLFGGYETAYASGLWKLLW